MTAYEIIEKYLRDSGYDGLCYPKTECGCLLGGLFPCGYAPADCVPGYKRSTPDGDWEVVPGKNEEGGGGGMSDSKTIEQEINGKLRLTMGAAPVLCIEEGCFHQVFIDQAHLVDLAMQLLELAGWQPMDTAPRDGRWVWVLFKFDNPKTVAVRWWAHGSNPAWEDCGGDKYCSSKADGWLPLPEIKEAEDGK